VLRRPLRIATRLGRDDGGQDLVEWALLTAFIAVAGILLFSTISGKLATAYSTQTGSPGSGVQQIWEPCAPGVTPPC
jgi:Flp pilus assembly pilin Flp